MDKDVSEDTRLSNRQLSALRIGTLRYQDGELRRGQHRKSKTGTSPVVAANNKMLKIVYFCVGRRRRYFFDL